ncbi:hypothetical protein O3G_MSEX003197 [Manduca sexta]|uniref:Uncharacterized protein n=1 Tax=Manduca sexta TaxID=7130 RepID=A0A921YS55_MANSE|nr:hypothetical protein O3G_MSEX003197 [Manduca sexta]
MTVTYKTNFGMTCPFYFNMNTLLCILVLVIGFRHGSAQFETPTLAPDLLTPMNAMDANVTNTEVESRFMSILEEFLRNNTNASSYRDALENLFNSTFNNETAAKVTETVLKLFQDAERTINVITNNGEGANDMVQQLLNARTFEEVVAQASEIGQDFARTIIYNIIAPTVGIRGSGNNAMLRLLGSNQSFGG